MLDVWQGSECTSTFVCFGFYRETNITREEILESALVNDVINDSVLFKIEKRVEVLYYEEMLSKSLSLLENGWVRQTNEGKYRYQRPSE